MFFVCRPGYCCISNLKVGSEGKVEICLYCEQVMLAPKLSFLAISPTKYQYYNTPVWGPQTYSAHGLFSKDWERKRDMSGTKIMDCIRSIRVPKYISKFLRLLKLSVNCGSVPFGEMKIAFCPSGSGRLNVNLITQNIGHSRERSFCCDKRVGKCVITSFL